MPQLGNVLESDIGKILIHQASASVLGVHTNMLGVHGGTGELEA
jgi:hypothetical protein